MKEVFSMWKYTRMIILVALSAAIYAAFLIVFKGGIPIVPGVTEVRPANVLPPVFGLLFGPAGAWGAAIKLLERIPDLDPTPSIRALQARFLATNGQADDAIRLLEEVDPSTMVSGRDRALVRLTLANALTRTPRHEEVADLLQVVVRDQDAWAVYKLWTNWRAPVDLLPVEAEVPRPLALVGPQALCGWVTHGDNVALTGRCGHPGKVAAIVGEGRR